MKCEFCKRDVESVDDADMCEECKDEWMAAERADWMSLWVGEKRAGLIPECGYRHCYGRATILGPCLTEV